MQRIYKTTLYYALTAAIAFTVGLNTKKDNISSSEKIEFELAKKKYTIQTNTVSKIRQEALQLGLTQEDYISALANAVINNQKMIDAGMLSSGYEPAGFSTVGDDGKVTTKSLELAGIPADDIDFINTEKDKLWDEMSNSILNRIQVNQSKTNPDSGVFAYNITADPIAGKQNLNNFRDRIASEYGAAAADKLLSGMQNIRYFGDFGRLNVEIVFQKYKGDTVVTYKGTDPASGKSVISGTCDADKFPLLFGNSFDLSNYK